MLRNEIQIRKYIEAYKKKRLKKIDKDNKRKSIKNAQESILRAKHRKHMEMLAKEAERRLESKYRASRTIVIYSTRYIERFMDDGDVYNTIEELKQDESGRINWEFWDFLVNKTRNEIKENVHI